MSETPSPPTAAGASMARIPMSERAPPPSHKGLATLAPDAVPRAGFSARSTLCSALALPCAPTRRGVLPRRCAILGGSARHSKARRTQASRHGGCCPTVTPGQRRQQAVRLPLRTLSRTPRCGSSPRPPRAVARNCHQAQLLRPPGVICNPSVTGYRTVRRDQPPHPSNSQALPPPPAPYLPARHAGADGLCRESHRVRAPARSRGDVRIEL